MSKLNCILIGLFLVVGCSLQGRGQTNDTLVVVDVKAELSAGIPSFPGGEQARMKFLQDNIVYPRGAMEQGIDGTVFVSFIVEEDGSIINIEVSQSVHKLLDEEAVRVTKLMPKWKPAIQKGTPIRVRHHMTVKFVLVD